MDQDLLAALLFCETLYEEGESLGKIIDKELMQILVEKYGTAQYNYASVYVFTNILMQISPTFVGDLYSRIEREAVTLLYVELVLSEEAAIYIANDEIIKFLTNVTIFNPRDVLKNINFIVTEHVKSIEFWDIQMNYPSSKQSLNKIRNKFKIEPARRVLKRNQEQLLMIYNTRSGIVDKAEAGILSILGAILTVISVVNFIFSPNEFSNLIFIITAFVIGVFILYKRYVIKNLLSKK
ncbi:MAG: hypothetical protein LUH15_02650 [Tannerellaceae bacterium]|nr:hypothetical protein [Tannerellaceae bacterium]